MYKFKRVVSLILCFVLCFTWISPTMTAVFAEETGPFFTLSIDAETLTVEKDETITFGVTITAEAGVALRSSTISAGTLQSMFTGDEKVTVVNITNDSRTTSVYTFTLSVSGIAPGSGAITVMMPSARITAGLSEDYVIGTISVEVTGEGDPDPDSELIEPTNLTSTEMVPIT